VSAGSASAGSVTAADLAPRLRLVVARLARRLRQQAEGEITQSQVSALATLDNHGPLTLKDLAAHERVRPPTMTRVVDALEELGLVTRTVDDQDRRVVRAALTADGRRLIERNRRLRNEWLRAAMRGLDEHERATLEAAVPVLERLLEEGRP
jgi:DNA-binding MarR family transcriptional regulator